MIHETETTDDNGFGAVLHVRAFAFMDTCSSACCSVLWVHFDLSSAEGGSLLWMCWDGMEDQLCEACLRCFSPASSHSLPFYVAWLVSGFCCKEPVGLSLTLIFIPGVERNNCELYVPFCGLKRIMCY